MLTTKKLLSPFAIVLLFSIVFSNCKTEKKDASSDLKTETKVESDYFEVITQNMDFQSVDTLKSGWNNLRYKNLSNEVHFILMDKLPSDSINKNDINHELLPPFSDGMKYLMEGKADSAMAAFGSVPTWFHEVKRYGGTGLISPMKVTNTTINLVPGKYMMECYVKMANGEWHTSHGMWKFITVIDQPTNITPPEANLTLTISSTEGYKLTGEPSIGKNVFKVNFIDQVPYEHFSGHDVNLIKYEEDANIDALIEWLNWMNPDGLRTPTPQGFSFIGGINNCEAGETGYFEAELKAGNYILVSETPKADEKKLMHTFTLEQYQHSTQ